MFLRWHHAIKTWTAGGQISTLLILFIAATLMLTMVTFNIGKVSLVRTGTAIAADAAALAAASWMASMENELASVGRSMWLYATIYDTYFLLPVWGGGCCGWPPCGSCGPEIVQGVTYVLELWASYYWTKLKFNKKAFQIMAIGWNRAHLESITAAIANAGIDDNRDEADPNSLKAKRKQINEAWKNGQKYPKRKTALGETGDLCAPGDTSNQKSQNPYFEHVWDRNLKDGSRGQTRLVVEVDFPCAPPNFIYNRWKPLPKVWSPNIVFLIFTCYWAFAAPGWKPASVGSKFGDWAKKWIALPLPIAKPSFEETCFPIPVFIPAELLDNEKRPGPPGTLEYPSGKIRVIVRRSEQDANLRLWTMKYGNPSNANATEVASMAVAEYTTPSNEFSMFDWPSSKAVAKLVSVQ